MARKRRDKTAEYARNIFLIALAAAVVVIFFNLDIIKKGESVFSKSSDRKIKFAGDLERAQYTKKEVARLLKYAKKYDDLYDEIIINATRQDSYKAVTATSQVLFEIKMTMTDGSTVSTPTRRCQRKELVDDIIAKLRKDFRAYRELMDKGTKVKSLVNTM